jgi:hypothetical protein
LLLLVHHPKRQVQYVSEYDRLGDHVVTNS